MEVITIYSDDHGLIGIAKDYNSAIQFLIEKHWIEDDTELWLNGECMTVTDRLTSLWRNLLPKLSINEFNEIFNSTIILHERMVLEYPKE